MQDVWRGQVRCWDNVFAQNPLRRKRFMNKKLDILKAGFCLAPQIVLQIFLCISKALQAYSEAIWVPVNSQPTLSITVCPDPFQHPQFSLGVYLCTPVMQPWRPRTSD